ncbi:MAG TPA: prolipoprotein diacylglyceryl transferase [Hyphomicrobiaceae bacterium]|nr:prolipoprotein diacylglyceryl transferase [Hyphomicrobiaceae bacterium]
MPILAIPYPAIDPVAFSIGPLSVKWYGLAYVAGLLLGWYYIKRLLSRPELWAGKKAPFKPIVVDDLFVWVALGVVVGGRLGHVLFYEPALYLSNPLQILMIHKGGMAFHGGMLGTIVAMYLFARRHGLHPLNVMDPVAAAVPFGLFFGRIANFINAEVVGAESDVPWAMVFPGWGPNPRHPSQLYEALLEGLVLFLVLRWLTHTKGALKQPGVVGGTFILGYGAARMFCELFKHDEYQVFGALPVTTGMIYSIPMLLVGWLLIWNGRRTAPA